MPPKRAYTRRNMDYWAMTDSMEEDGVEAEGIHHPKTGKKRRGRPRRRIKTTLLPKEVAAALGVLKSAPAARTVALEADPYVHLGGGGGSSSGRHMAGFLGRKVQGVVDGTFDAGLLVSLRVAGDAREVVYHGVIFGPGLSVPLSAELDVAAEVRRTCRAPPPPADDPSDTAPAGPPPPPSRPPPPATSIAAPSAPYEMLPPRQAPASSSLNLLFSQPPPPQSSSCFNQNSLLNPNSSASFNPNPLLNPFPSSTASSEFPLPPLPRHHNTNLASPSPFINHTAASSFTSILHNAPAAASLSFHQLSAADPGQLRGPGQMQGSSVQQAGFGHFAGPNVASSPDLSAGYSSAAAGAHYHHQFGAHPYHSSTGDAALSHGPC